jgi:undecaprenyl-diphosphatase
MDFELLFLDAIQSIRFGLLDSIMLLATHVGDGGLIWIILSLALLVHKKTRKIGLACALALVCSLVITNLGLKNIIGRARPYNYRDLILLIPTPKDFSFPSGHTSAAFSVVYVLLREKFKVKGVRVDYIALVLAVLMAFSRMYLYVHFPTDIIASLFIAYICARLGIYLSETIYHKIKK